MFAVSLGLACCADGCAGQSYRQISAEMDEAAAKHEVIMERRRAAPDSVLLKQYQQRIGAAITANWLRPDHLPDQPCPVHITQLPGGQNHGRGRGSALSL